MRKPLLLACLLASALDTQGPTSGVAFADFNQDGALDLTSTPNPFKDRE